MTNEFQFSCNICILKAQKFVSYEYKMTCKSFSKNPSLEKSVNKLGAVNAGFDLIRDIVFCFLVWLVCDGQIFANSIIRFYGLGQE